MSDDALVCPVCLHRDTEQYCCVGSRDYWRCHICEATFLVPEQLPSLDLEIGQYRLHRNEIDDSGYRAFLSRVADPLIARLEQGQEGLDYGCGPGPALAAMLEEAGQRMAVYDPLFFDSPEVLARQYDFITCSEVAEHFHRPAEEFQRLTGMVKPGGLLAVMTSFLTENTDFAHWHYRRDPTHVVFYREKTFRWIADHFGWSCEIAGVNVALLRRPVVKDSREAFI